MEYLGQFDRRAFMAYLRKMLTLWVAAFIVGQLCAFIKMRREAAIVAAISLISVIALWAIFQTARDGRRWPWLLWVCAVGAFGWGVATNYPPSETRVAAAIVVRATVFANGISELPMIVDVQGRKQVAKGPGLVGDLGKFEIYCRPASIELCSRRFSRRGSGPDSDKLSRVMSAIRKIRLAIEQRIRAADYDLHPWLQAILLGDLTLMEQDDLEQFRRTGLLHILVVSGFHVSVFSWIIQLIVLLPFRLLYSLRLFSAGTWRIVRPSLTILSVILAGFYVTLLGYSSPSQRAYLLFFVANLTLIFVGQLHLTQKIMFAIVLQTFVFPIGFVSSSTMLSWLAYIFVIAQPRGLKWSKIPIFIVDLQLRISALTLGLFGNISVIGILANIVLVPFFPVIYGLGIFAIFTPSSEGALAAAAFMVHRGYMNVIGYLARISIEYRWLYVEGLSPALQVIGLVLVAVLTLNRIREMSIRRRCLHYRVKGVKDE